MTKEELIELKNKVLKIKKAGEIEKIFSHKTLYERLYDVTMEKPDYPAILYFGNVITYRQLLSLVDNAAKGFDGLGIKYNDNVTMSMLACPYGIVSLFALDKIGAVMHMVNCASSAEEIKRELTKVPSKYFVGNDILCRKEILSALKEGGVKKIVTTSLTDGIPMGFNGDRIKYQIIEKLKGIKPSEYDGFLLLNYDQLLNVGKYSYKELEACKYDPNKLVTIAYTSGSTGQSKGCDATWERLDSMIQVMGMTEIGRFASNDVMFSTFPLWIYYSLVNMIIEPLILGVAVALDPLFDPKNIIKRNELYKFNHWLTIPPYIKKMVEMNKPTDCSKWKIIITGGTELQNEVKIKADQYIKENNGTAHVEQGYGASETLGSMAYCYNENPSLGSVGIPCVGNIVKIVDVDTREELGPNQIGAGYVYSPARMNGYHGDMESTNHNLVTDENGATWYFTEDLLEKNDAGEIFLKGRIRRIALTFDKNNNPTKIIPEVPKKSISTIAEIDNCEVITVPDKKVENTPIAFVVLKKGIVFDKKLENKIIKHCQDSIYEYMIPTEIIPIDEMPLTATKKPDLKKLEEIYNQSKNDVKTKRRF